MQQENFSVTRTVTVDFAHVKIKKPWQKGFWPEQITVVAGELLDLTSLLSQVLSDIAVQADYMSIVVILHQAVTNQVCHKSYVDDVTGNIQSDSFALLQVQ